MRSPSTSRCLSVRCQPRGRTSSVATSSSSEYVLSPCSSEIVPSIASVRLTWPCSTLLHVGEFESSKSAMKPVEPLFRALITILRSVGPVISTQRFCRSAGAGATVQSPSRTSRVSSRKSSVPPSSRARCRSARLSSSSRRRPSKRRCSSATNSRASSERTSFAAVTSTPLAVAISSSHDRLVEKLHRVQHGHPVPEPFAVGRYLDRAAGVRRGHDLGAGVEQVARLSAAEVGGGVRLHEVVDAGRAAAHLPLRRVDELELRDHPQQVARLRADALRVRQMAGVVVGDLAPQRGALRPRVLLGEELIHVEDLPGEE